jgi:hypothetical protein
VQRFRVISKRIINLAETIKIYIMTREEKCKLAIERGYTYDPETGAVYGKHGKEINQTHLGYIRITLFYNNKFYKVFAHQFAWYVTYKECVECLDHINSIRSDNRICNLRSITQHQNLLNNKKAKGYSWAKDHKKWKSMIKYNNEQIFLGYYNSEQEARNAYLAAKEIYHKI